MPPQAMIGRTMLAATLLALGMVSGGCKVTSTDVDVWKGTVKGPGKMVAVMLAEKYELELRSYAGLALVDMERTDVDGVAELQRTLGMVEQQTRDSIIDSLTPGLIELMNAPVQGADPNDGPPARQVRAKDAAFLLINQAKPETRAKLTDAVVGWYTLDFNGRNLSGNYSAEQVVRALGSSAATRLVDALNAKLPQQALTKLSELIGQLGSEETKQAAADRLVAIEAEMRSEKFMVWLKGQISEQMQAAGSKPEPARVAKMAALNRDKFVDSGVIPAMKHLADQPKVADRLLQIASTKGKGLSLRRTRALQALEGKARKEHLDALLALALDESAPAPVRDYAFDRVGDIRDPKAIPSMWALVKDAKNQRLRWRAGELILTIGGTKVLGQFFANLPGGDAKYEPEELEGYAVRMSQMMPLPRKVAAAQLSSPNWYNRIIGLYFFQRRGSEADVARMQRLAGESTSVKGKNWEEGQTVGKVAKQAIDGLRERLKTTGETPAPTKAG